MTRRMSTPDRVVLTLACILTAAGGWGMTVAMQAVTR